MPAAAGKRIGAPELRKLLAKAKADSTFRDKLLSSPANTLTAEGLRPDDHWVKVFGRLTANNFEAEMNKTIDIVEGEAKV
jgi:hypothetical protein